MTVMPPGRPDGQVACTPSSRWQVCKTAPRAQALSAVAADPGGVLVTAQRAPARVAHHQITRPVAEGNLADEPRLDPLHSARMLGRDGSSNGLVPRRSGRSRRNRSARTGSPAADHDLLMPDVLHLEPIPARARVIPRGQRFDHDALQPVRDADGQDVLSVTAVPRGCPDRFGIQGQFLESLAALGMGERRPAIARPGAAGRARTAPGYRRPVAAADGGCASGTAAHRSPGARRGWPQSHRPGSPARRPSRPARPVPDRCWPCPGRCARPGGQGRR